MMQKVAHECSDPEQIRRQMADYLEELNQYDPDNDGMDYPYLDFYWREPDRHPFLLRCDGQTCGFALIRRETTGTEESGFHSIAEFYIQPQFRRRGIGLLAVKELLERFPGPWLIQVLIENVSAQKFWQETLSRIVQERLNPSKGVRFYDFRLTT